MNESLLSQTAKQDLDEDHEDSMGDAPKKKMRGDMKTLRELITKVNNCAFVYGCEPALGVFADTNYASDIQ